MSFTAGTRLGPYEIQTPLGTGGMGEVYRARDTRLDRTVAIKVLPDHVAAHPELRQRFEREARTISSLNHPHICALYDVGSQDGTDFLVMEFLQGETLADRLAKGALPTEQALRYAVEIADALDKAHRQGIVHRDIKPGNIMLTKSGTKLLDFGLAKLQSRLAAAGSIEVSAAPTVHSPLTGVGSIVGTFQYMAPEQIEGQDADVRSDIFSFGAVLYEMLAGRKAFDGKSQASLISAILKDEPPPVSMVQPLVPAGLDRVIRTCLAKDPDDRWQTARDLLRELTWVREAAPQPSDRTVAHVGRRERIAWGVAALGAVASVALVLTLGGNTGDSSPNSAPVTFEISTPPTDDPLSFALSPDGRQLVFVANGDDGASRLFVRPLDRTTAEPLADTDGASYPFWSPDSRSLAFFADSKLKRIDLAGGTSVALADAPVGRGGTWSEDDVIVFTPNSSGGLWRVSAAGGPATPLLEGLYGRKNTGLRFPHFLPDGRRFLFFAALFADIRGLYLGSLDGGEPTRVLAANLGAAVYVPPGYLLLQRQDQVVAVPFDPVAGTASDSSVLVTTPVGFDGGLWKGAFSASASGSLAYRTSGAIQRRQLVWVNREGKTLGTIGPPSEMTMAYPELSPDGRRVALVATSGSNVDVWTFDVTRGVSSRFTSDPNTDGGGALWSPDGARVVFASNRNGVYDLFEKPANGAGNEQPLFVSPEEKRVQSWSADGRFLLYMNQSSSTGRDLWVLPLTGERKPFPVVQTRFDDYEGQFSPDGGWIAYVSTESGRREIYVRPFPDSGEAQRVSTAGGSQVRWHPNGRELYYVAPDARLMAVPINGSSDGRGLNAGTPVPLFHTRLATGGNVTGHKPQYAVAPDGRFLLNVRISDAETPITVMLNWLAGIETQRGS